MGSAASGLGQRNWRARASTVVAAAAVALLGAQALAQPLERNLPAEPQSPPTVIAEPPLPGSISDDRSLGANLSAIVLLGPTAAVTPSPKAGIDASQVGRLDKPRALRALAGFLGRPITRKLIGEVETAIVREYRRQGYPFVEVSTPEQEITGGSLQIRVVEFHVGRLAVAHARPGEDGYIDARIRTRPGDEIASASLIQDLDWLNRYPYRTLAPTFAAGAGLGETDLTLAATYVRPWSLNAGYSNSGSPATGEDRIFVGASASGHLLTDAFISVQVTGSPDFWATDGRLFDSHHPQYGSVAGRLLAATAPRQDIELTIDAVETNEPVSPFVIRQDTFEASLAYRSALSNLVRAPGDISGGVEWSRQARHTFFGDVDVLDTSVDVFQLYGDWSNQWSDGLGAASVDVSVHGSPGGVGGLNSSAAFANFTNGRVTSAAYVYGAASYVRQTKLPLGLILLTQFNGQYAGRAIPDSQQIALGGQSAVRGYTIDDGAWDDGAVAHDELSAAPISLVRLGAVALDAAPFVFLDAGYGRDEAARQDHWVSSAGVGGDLRLGANATAGLDLAWPLLNAKISHAGDMRFDAKVSIFY